MVNSGNQFDFESQMHFKQNMVINDKGLLIRKPGY